MTVLVKKVFTSSKPVIVRLLCPPPRGPFSIQESAVGGLSYKVKNIPSSSMRSNEGIWQNLIVYVAPLRPILNQLPIL